MPENLTNPEYWDGVWCGKNWKSSKISRFHPYFGSQGIFMKMVKRNVGQVEGCRVLELGGGGFNYRLLALGKWGKAKVTAIDFSSKGLDSLQSVFAMNNATVTSLCGDFLDCDLGDKSFDLVVHWGVLEHFSNPAQVLDQCARRLVPNGSVLFTMPNMESWAARYWKKWSPQNWQRHILHSDRRIYEDCESVGLKPNKVFYFGHPCMKVTEWEIEGWRQSALSLAQYSARLSAVPFRYYHAVGAKRISMERGFVARRIL